MRYIRTLIAILCFLFFFSLSLSYAAMERRTALVIGNSSYESSPLKNPANDAKDMADTLRSMGFKVILKTNASKRDIGKSIEDFGRQLKGGNVGLFYYAGHGVQVNGVNYLIPIGAKINAESDVEYEAIDAGRILSTMNNAKSRVNIVILDACRDNPYARSFRTTTRGLAIIAKAPIGTIISYSTSPGDVALDGKGRNSPYTSSLLQYMKQPGVTIEQVFKNVRQKIDLDTSGKQVPWELSSLKGEFFFIPGKASTLVTKNADEVLSPKEMPADELELAMAKVQEKKDEEARKKSEKEDLYRALASDIKKYRAIEVADIDEKTKERALQSLMKKYPQWSAGVGIKESILITRVIQEDKSGASKILSEEGINRFIAYDNGTVFDTWTNLMWAAKDNKSGIWQNAKSYCERYRGGGYTDWRMPTQDELAGLYDPSIKSPLRCGLTPLIEQSHSVTWASETRGSEAAAFNFYPNPSNRFWEPQSCYNECPRALPVRSVK